MNVLVGCETDLSSGSTRRSLSNSISFTNRSSKASARRSQAHTGAHLPQHHAPVIPVFDPVTGKVNIYTCHHFLSAIGSNTSSTHCTKTNYTWSDCISCTDWQSQRRHIDDKFTTTLFCIGRERNT